jgi:hypothetical protein
MATRPRPTVTQALAVSCAGVLMALFGCYGWLVNIERATTPVWAFVFVAGIGVLTIGVFKLIRWMNRPDTTAITLRRSPETERDNEK